MNPLGGFSIHETLTWLQATNFPHFESKLAVYYELSGCRGFTQTTARIISLGEDETEVVRIVDGGVGSPGPLALIGGGASVSGKFEFQKPGWYALDFLCNGELASQR